MKEKHRGHRAMPTVQARERERQTALRLKEKMERQWQQGQLQSGKLKAQWEETPTSRKERGQ